MSFAELVADAGDEAPLLGVCLDDEDGGVAAVGDADPVAGDDGRGDIDEDRVVGGGGLGEQLAESFAGEAFDKAVGRGARGEEGQAGDIGRRGGLGERGVAREDVGEAGSFGDAEGLVLRGTPEVRVDDEGLLAGGGGGVGEVGHHARGARARHAGEHDDGLVPGEVHLLEQGRADVAVALGQDAPGRSEEGAVHLVAGGAGVLAGVGDIAEHAGPGDQRDVGRALDALVEELSEEHEARGEAEADHDAGGEHVDDVGEDRLIGDALGLGHDDASGGRELGDALELLELCLGVGLREEDVLDLHVEVLDLDHGLAQVDEPEDEALLLVGQVGGLGVEGGDGVVQAVDDCGELLAQLGIALLAELGLPGADERLGRDHGPMVGAEPLALHGRPLRLEAGDGLERVLDDRLVLHRLDELVRVGRPGR